MFSVERRTKEIGIRKVLGATVSGIFLLLTQNIVKLILLSFMVASPLAWYFVTQWLDNFAYKIDIGIITFIVAGAMTLSIALITIGFQSIKASIANPVKSLKYE
jgi:putative ABC transport system permease protein